MGGMDGRQPGQIPDPGLPGRPCHAPVGIQRQHRADGRFRRHPLSDIDPKPHFGWRRRIQRVSGTRQQVPEAAVKLHADVLQFVQAGFALLGLRGFVQNLNALPGQKNQQQAGNRHENPEDRQQAPNLALRIQA